MKIKFQGTAQDIAQIEEGTCLMLRTRSSQLPVGKDA